VVVCHCGQSTSRRQQRHASDELPVPPRDAYDRFPAAPESRPNAESHSRRIKG